MCSKSPHVVRLDDALTDVGTVQFTTTMDYDNLNRRLQFWCKNQSYKYNYSGAYRNASQMEFLLYGGDFRWRSKAARTDNRLFVLQKVRFPLTEM